MSDPKPGFDVLGQLGPMLRYALSLTRNAAEAEDLVHDSLVRALERKDQFKAERNLRGWLLSILHNAFVDRTRGRRAETLRNEEVAWRTEWRIDAPQEQSARLAEVREAFLSLPEAQRAALHLVSIEGLTYDDAAAALGVPVGTVVSRISRARARLREIEDGVSLEPSPAPSNVVHLKIVGGPHDAPA